MFTENVERSAAKDGMATRDYLNSKNKDWLAKSADELGIKYNTKTTKRYTRRKERLFLGKQKFRSRKREL